MARLTRLMSAALIAASMVACGSDSGDNPGMGMPDGPGTDNSPIGSQNPGEDGSPPEGSSPGEDMQGEDVDTPVAGGEAVPPEPGSEVEPPDETDSLCDSDPHRTDCIDTHVRGQCDIDSGYPGDDTCLLPPPEGQGIQIHVGPDDYTDAAQVAPFLLQPGAEETECYLTETPNDELMYYQGWTLSGRPGTHHIINTGFSTPHSQNNVFGACRFDAPDTTGRVPGASKPYMPRFEIAPENEGLGYPVNPRTAVTSDMHYFNYTDEPILREYWLNMYAVPPDKVTETPNRIRGYGGLSFNITPGTDMVYSYSCPIDADGRITALLGHTHAHSVRFTAWVSRGMPNERKVFEAYDYLEPQIYAYNTVEQNPEFSDSAPGAWTGMLEVSAGETLDWECHVINDSDATLRFTNYVDTGEMCNIWGESVGPTIDCNRF